MKKNKKLVQVLKKQAVILGIWTLGVIAGASAVNWYYLIPTLEETQIWVNSDIVVENTSHNMENGKLHDGELVKAQEESTRLEGDSRSVIATTYNPTEAQTDSDPFTMASGKKVYEGAVASNCHPLGTKLDIKGMGVMVVEDRMNSRFTKDCGTENERLDIFKFKKEDNFKKTVEYAKL